MRIKKILLIVCVFLLFDGYGLAQNTIRIAKYKGDRICAVSYTFDDGLEEHYTLVYPVLEKYGIKGTFCISGSKIENRVLQRGMPPVTWAQLREMSDNGHEISNHGWSHQNLTKLTNEEINSEIEKNDSIIYEKTGLRPYTFCYPGNAKNHMVIALASLNRVATRVEQRSVGSKSTPEDLENWIRILKNKQAWGIGMTHGITYGYDPFSDPSVLWDHLQKEKDMQDSLWIGTFREIAAYIKERDSLKLHIIKDTSAELNIFPELSLDKRLFSDSLTIVIDQSDIKHADIRQNERKLNYKIDKDKLLFDFDPHGGMIQIKKNTY